jgi:hypothetical protein
VITGLASGQWDSSYLRDVGAARESRFGSRGIGRKETREDYYRKETRRERGRRTLVHDEGS